MKVATFNAASVRARLPVLVEWLAEVEPDVLAIQETKVEDEKFPRSEFEDLGYHIAVHGQKAWNGVAILSRSPIQDVRSGFMDEMMPTDARIISAEIDGIRIINTYVPNGSAVGSDKFVYKLGWLDRFARFLPEQFRADQPLIWLGDINIAPTSDDLYDHRKFYGSVGHHPDEISRLETILQFGLTDLFRLKTEGPGHYTFWDFTLPRGVDRNLGWRIDHIYGTPSIVERLVDCTIDRGPRKWPKPSDHTFVIAELAD